MAAESAEFTNLLNRLLSQDNDIRSQAEEALSKINPEPRVSFLLNAIASPGADEGKQLSAVLLRRVITNEWTSLQSSIHPDAMSALKTQVLLGVQTPSQSDSLRKKMCDVAAELARNLMDDDGNFTWQEFLQFLFQSASSDSPALKDSALRIFSSIPGIFGNQEAQYLDLIKQMLQQNLLPTHTYEVRVQAVRAVSAFVMIHEKETHVQKHFADLLPTMIEVIVESIQKQDDDVLLKCLIDLAEATPKYLRTQLVVIMDVCLKVLEPEDMDENWKSLALEVMVTLAESASGMVRKVAGAQVIAALIHQVLQMMTLLDEEEDWSTQDTVLEEDSSSPSVIAESSIDRLAIALGGRTMLPLIVENIPKMLGNPDWKYRHAALMAISSVGEGCHKQMEDMLGEIMEGVLNFLQDPHARVRFAACNAVGQMAADFAPIFEKKFHDKVIPGLLMVLDDNANPRTQAHAGAAMVNFSESCPKDILKQYLDPIMNKLEEILNEKLKGLMVDGRKLVLEQIVTTIASVADTVEELFIPYYDRLIPCLKYIIENANKEEYKLLRGKTIECVSLIGLAVGAEKFMRDASEVMDLLLKTHSTQQLADDDPQTTYLMSAWARMCKILGKGFQQYLPLVMGPVMRTASMKPEVALLDNDDLQDVEEDVDWQFVALGEQRNFGIKTAGLEEKASACEMLVCYARYLGDGFADYVEEVVNLMVPLLKFYFHDTVRVAAAESLPCLLESGKAKGPEFLQAMWTYICRELLKAIDTEPEQDVLSDLMHSFAMCVETLGAGCLSEESMTEVIKLLDKLMVGHYERADERGTRRKDEDYDEIVEEKLEDEDCEDVLVLSKVADVLHSLFLTYKTAFFPYLDRIIHHFVKLLGPEMPWADHQWGICIFDDIIEYGGPACAKYKDYFLPAIVNFTQDNHAEVRQAAVYGCGVIGQFAGPAFAQVCAEALPLLVRVIMAPESRSAENLNPTENAVSAVTKMLKYNSSAINVEEIIPLWLSWLPVWEDTEESPHVYGYLCDLIEGNHPAVLGQNGSNIPKLMAIFGEALHREAFETKDEVGRRVLVIIRQIQSNEEMFKQCLIQTTEDQQRALHVALTTAL